MTRAKGQDDVIRKGQNDGQNIKEERTEHNTTKISSLNHYNALIHTEHTTVPQT